MRKKVKTTSLQREILWALAETGEYSLPVLLNDLLSKFSRLSRAALQNEVERSLGILWRAGCLYLFRNVGGERKTILVPEMDDLDLRKIVLWDEAVGIWTVSDENVVDVKVQLTNGGVEWLDLIAAQSDVPVPVWKPRS